MDPFDNPLQPLIDPSTPNDVSNFKYTEPSPSTMVEMTPMLTSSKTNNKNGSAQKPKEKKSRVIKPIFFVNLSNRLTNRKKLHRRLTLITDVMCILAAIGVILMVTENEITFRQVNNKDTVTTWYLKLIITLTTIVLVALVFYYHYTNLKLYAIAKFSDDWRIGLTYQSVLMILVEVIVCAIHPFIGSFPSASNKFIKHSTELSSTSEVQRKSYITADVALGLPMFARLYLLARFSVNHSRLSHSKGARALGQLSRVPINFNFLIKTYLDRWPIGCLLTFCLATFIIGSWSLRACDYTATNQHLTMLDAMWLFIITYTTVGYGDFTPTSYCGRSIATVIAFIGILTSALLITLLAQKLALNRWEKYVEHFAAASELADKHKNEAANVVKYAIKLWYIKRNSKPGSRSEFIRIRKKVLKSLNKIEEIKNEQRQLSDHYIGLPEIASLQKNTDNNADDTHKKVLSLENKIENIQGQLGDVKDSIGNLQNTLNRLADRSTIQ